MCDSISHLIEPIFSATFYPVLAYDAVIGIGSLIRFMNQRKGRSAVKLGVAITAFCAVAGCLYGAFNGPYGDGQRLVSLGILFMLYAWPMIDFVFKKHRSQWDYFLRLPLSFGFLFAGGYIVFVLNSAYGTFN